MSGLAAEPVGYLPVGLADSVRLVHAGGTDGLALVGDELLVNRPRADGGRAVPGVPAASLPPPSPARVIAARPRTAACWHSPFGCAPSSIRAGTASGSAPALRHSPAAWRASGSSNSPSDVPWRIPATSASRSARPPASAWSSAPAADSSSPVSAPRHRAQYRASPVSYVTRIRSAYERRSIMHSSTAPGQSRVRYSPGFTPWPRASPRRAPPGGGPVRP